MVCLDPGSAGGRKDRRFHHGPCRFSRSRHAGIHPDPGFIQTADGVSLFYRDWGTGKPIVFVASWVMPSESWSYQMAGPVGTGFPLHRL